ncbi:hypothetical protein [Trinickia mobilis]|uniref:hypothetical protein n=1 Tax=Trinickia mobilis TaxID=2816356 RepID=UPI001A8E152C|nr:hypothetical protein [Trinickia mobilis]
MELHRFLADYLGRLPNASITDRVDYRSSPSRLNLRAVSAALASASLLHIVRMRRSRTRFALNFYGIHAEPNSPVVRFCTFHFPHPRFEQSPCGG